MVRLCPRREHAIIHSDPWGINGDRMMAEYMLHYHADRVTDGVRTTECRAGV